MHQTPKNGKKGDTIHHDSTPSYLCPVNVLTHCMHSLSTNFKTPTALLSLVWIPQNEHKSISDQDITTAVQWGATIDGLPGQGYSLDQVSSHSLQAVSDKALKLNGCDSETIMHMG